ncbi:type VI secretion system baseplate subunit TssG [Sphingomonas sp.]|jgi:type VI secretion system protein ImpH|uniref:type VI secretion system baseplate subunit TssG n=1 Tax=Sphingomonas sp. TaxID=28214 RepID=UPI002D7E3713|nr:type VI secretion system baseplate subunit TssG [Sphingomonas sp.]HEU0044676.1 type VI secretion system baseplate subunit TssG [Sphingomonas sp.]
MVAADRPPAEHLTFLQRAGAQVRRYGMFPLVRGAEARAPAMPRVGRSRLPAQSIVDLAQVPHLGFPDSTMQEVEVRHGRPTAHGLWLGLTGPMGPLPTHLTEFALYERRYGTTRPFGRWLDVIANRMLQLFYRVWGDSQPAVQADRPEDDRFAHYLGALSGAAEGVGEDALFPARARLYYAALFGSRRSAVAIEDALGHLLRQPVRVLEYQPRWRDIEVADQTRLGRSFARLDEGVVVGARTREASDAFRVAIRANSMKEYERLLPSSPRFAIASEALDAFAPSHLEWDIMIEMEERHARPAHLDGRTQLGWTGWLKPGSGDNIRSDAHLTRRARGMRATLGGNTT